MFSKTSPITLPVVARVRDTSGDHIEPELNCGWDEATRLAWHAAVTSLDTGLPVTLAQFGKEYCLTVGGTGISSMPYREAWAWLSAVSIGAREALRYHRTA